MNLTAFLDLPRRAEIMALLQDLAHSTGKAILLSTHDLDLALRCADRIYLLPFEGALQTGAPEDLILNGAFEGAFQSDGVRFDVDTGAFKLNTQRGRASVAVSGKGRRAYWTKRALERAGFQVQDGGTRWRVDIREGDTWCVEHSGSVRKYDSICDLIAALKSDRG